MKRVICTIIIILLLIVVFGLGYYLADNNLMFRQDNHKNANLEEKNTNDNIEKDVLKVVAVDDVKYLYDTVAIMNESCASYYNYYYQNDELLINNMNDDFKISLALYHAYVDKKVKYDGAGNRSYITEDTLNEYFYKIFSSDVRYDTGRINHNGDFKAGYPFNFENNKFYTASIGCTLPQYTLYKKITMAKKSAEKVEIYEKIAYAKRENNYDPETRDIMVNKDDKSILFTISSSKNLNDETMQKYLDKLNTYKYTFEYIAKDKDYKFVKVEKVQ